METKQLGPSCLSSPCVKAQNRGDTKASPVSRVLIKSTVCEQLTVLQEDRLEESCLEQVPANMGDGRTKKYEKRQRV